MIVFEIIVTMLLIGAALAAFARFIGAPYPALVALAGTVLACIPGVPTLVLDPELALALFVAPVLLDAAYDASPRDLKANWKPVASLALGAVALTIFIVALLVKLLVPDMPWGAAIALGAIVAPPDAAAASAVLRQLRPPHRLLVILEGESLFNDASALLVYRLAIGATITGVWSNWDILPTFFIVTAGSFVLGFVLAKINLFVASRINDIATAVVLQFCSAFGVWMLAERLHLSGIITMVVFAMVAARQVPKIVPARIRIPSWAVWEVAVFVLNVLAFILVGFQLKSIAAKLTVTTGLFYAAVAVIVCTAVIITRLVWVFGATAITRWRCRRNTLRNGDSKPNETLDISPKTSAVVGWCGMRGTVTLATALALPTNLYGGEPFPYRDLILVTAFGVVLGTLVLQGLTLRPLLLRLGLKDDGSVNREVRLARVNMLRAAVETASKYTGPDSADLIQKRYEFQLRRAQWLLATEGTSLSSNTSTDSDLKPETLEASVGHDVGAAVAKAAIQAQRQCLVTLRANGTIGDAAFQRVEEELDWVELGWAQLMQADQPTDTHE